MARVFYSSECLCGILHIRSTVGCQMLTLHCVGERGLQKYSMYVQMSIHCVEYAFKVKYLSLVARNL